MTLAKNIVKFRKDNEFTQEELGERIGISRQSISKWETDETLPSIDNLITLSGLLNVSLDELITGEQYLHFPYDFGKCKNRWPIYRLVGSIILIMCIFGSLGTTFLEKVTFAILAGGLSYLLIMYTSRYDYKQLYNYWTLTKKGIFYVESPKNKLGVFLSEIYLPLRAFRRKKYVQYIPYTEIREMTLVLDTYGFDPNKVTTLDWSISRNSHIVQEKFVINVCGKNGNRFDLNLSSSFIFKSEENTMLLSIISFLKRKNFEFNDPQNIVEIRNKNGYDWINSLYIKSTNLN